MTVATNLAILLLVADYGAAFVLALASRRYPSVPLGERAVAAGLLAFTATLIAVILVNRQLGHPLQGEIAAAFILAAVVGCSAPSLYWLALLVTGRFAK